MYSDMPGSELANEMATRLAGTNTQAWSSLAYASVKTGKPYQTKEWLVPGVQRVRGGKKRNYSQYLHLSELSCGSARFHFNATVEFKPSDVVIVTKGEAGSTAALFSNHAAKYAHVKTAVVGQHDPSDQQYTSFPGLQGIQFCF